MLNKLADELKEIRLSKGLTLQQVSVKTRIDHKFLEAMETGDFEFLPELYVKAFYKEYLRLLGLDEQLYLKKYEAARQGKIYEEHSKTPEIKDVPPAKEPEPVREQKNLTSFDAVRKYKHMEDESSASRKRQQKLLYYLTGGTIVLVGILYLLIFRNSDDIVVPEKSWDQVMEEKDTTQQQNTDEYTNSAPSDSLRLTIHATDTSWIRIVLDDDKTEEFLLLPGSQKSVKAFANYKVTFGNAAAVKFDLNNRTLNFQGRRGAVQRLLIDSSGYKNLDEKTVGQ